MTFIKFATLMLITLNAFAFTVTEAYFTHNGVHRTLWWRVTCDNGKSYSVYRTEAEANKYGAVICKSNGSSFVSANPTSSTGSVVSDSFPTATGSSLPVFDPRFTQSSF
jgi:hypothetical protein